MPHFHFLEQKDESVTHEEAMDKVQKTFNEVASSSLSEKKNEGSGINITCTTMEDFLN
jgi:diaminopimelate decarboxylase